MSRTMQRAQRSARAVLHGIPILEFMRGPKTRRLLAAAAATGAPPVTAISAKLQELVGAEDAKLPPVRQFAGLCVRAVLEEEGFEVAAKGVRLSGDPVFRTSSTFQRAPIGNTNADNSFLVRLVQALTDDEASRFKLLLRRRADRGK